MENFAKNLKKLRKSKNWTAKEFSEAIKTKTGLEINQNTLFGYENNRREPSLDALVSIAKTLQVSIDNLLGNEITIKESPNYSDVVKRLDKLESMMSSGK